jgi:broad specificity phosphatase PhoE
MTTTMYLIRHGATAANLQKPARLQGRNDVPLDSVGVQQAKETGQALQQITFAAAYCSPLLRAEQTAALIAPYLQPQPVAALIECDVGRWENVDWNAIHRDFAEEYQQYMADPSTHGYPGGENFADVWQRVEPAFQSLLRQHSGQTFLVVSHHVVNRVYLSQVLGLPLRLGRRVSLDNCGISIVVADTTGPRVVTVNSTIHLRR